MKKFVALLLAALLAIMPMAAQADDLTNLLDVISDGCEALVQYFMSKETLTDTELTVYFQCAVMYIAGGGASSALTFDYPAVSDGSLGLASLILNEYDNFESGEASNSDSKELLDKVLGAKIDAEQATREKYEKDN